MISSDSEATVTAKTPVRSEPSTIGTQIRTPSARSTDAGTWSTNARPAIVVATTWLVGTSAWVLRSGSGSSVVCAKSARYTTTSVAPSPPATLRTMSGIEAGSDAWADRSALPKSNGVTIGCYRCVATEPFGPVERRSQIVRPYEPGAWTLVQPQGTSRTRSMLSRFIGRAPVAAARPERSEMEGAGAAGATHGKAALCARTAGLPPARQCLALPIGVETRHRHPGGSLPLSWPPGRRAPSPARG